MEKDPESPVVGSAPVVSCLNCRYCGERGNALTIMKCWRERLPDTQMYPTCAEERGPAGRCNTGQFFSQRWKPQDIATPIVPRQKYVYEKILKAIKRAPQRQDYDPNSFFWWETALFYFFLGAVILILLGMVCCHPSRGY